MRHKLSRHSSLPAHTLPASVLLWLACVLLGTIAAIGILDAADAYIEMAAQLESTKASLGICESAGTFTR